MSKIIRRLTALAAATVAALGIATPASALDVEAGDYTALPAGTNLLLLYYQHATRDKLYSGGDRVPINPGLDSNIGLLRGVHYTDIGGYIVDPQFILPFGKLKGKDDTAFLGSEDGIGDLIVGATVWLTKPGAKTHFGITPFFQLPTGDYDRNRALNLGENRWKFILNTGYITEIAPGLTLDLVGDVTLFGKNDDVNDGLGGITELKQKPQFQFQGFLRYNITPAFDVRGAVSYTTGGETEIGGVNQDNRQSLWKFNVGAGWFVGPTTQLLASYGRDLQVREGFKVDNQINLRVLQIF